MASGWDESPRVEARCCRSTDHQLNLRTKGTKKEKRKEKNNTTFKSTYAAWHSRRGNVERRGDTFRLTKRYMARVAIFLLGICARLLSALFVILLLHYYFTYSLLHCVHFFTFFTASLLYYSAILFFHILYYLTLLLRVFHKYEFMHHKVKEIQRFSHFFIILFNFTYLSLMA